MRTVLSTHLFLYHDLLEEEVLESIAAEGFREIELWAMRPHFPYDEPEKIKKIGEKVEILGISVATAHLPMYEFVYSPGQPRNLFGPSHEDENIRKKWNSHVKMALEAAYGLGARAFTMHTDLKFPGPDPRIDITARSIRDFLPVLPKDAVLAVENDVGGKEQIEGLLRLIDEIGDSPQSHRLGITLDLGHSLAGGDVMGCIELAAKHVRVIHAHDNSGERDEHLPPGNGVMPWKKVITSLERSFEGPFVWEVRDSTGGDDPKLLILKNILKEIASFKSS